MNLWAAVLAVLIVAASLLATAQPTRGDDKSGDAQALLDHVRALEDLRAEGGDPFVLRARFKANDGKHEFDGAYAITWLAVDRWHEELQLGNFKRVRDGVHGGFQQTRNLDFQPQVVFDFDKLINPAELAHAGSKEYLGKIHNRKFGGSTFGCAELLVKDARRRELCVDPTSGLLAQADIAADGLQVNYSGMLSLGKKQFPAQMRSLAKQGFSLDVSIDSLQPPATDVSLPAPNATQTEIWSGCTGSESVELVHWVPATYPQMAKDRQEQGEVTLYGRIETDGSVSHLKALGASSMDLVQSSLDAVAQWKYSPPVCRNVPVITETVITVIYSMSR